MAARRRRRSVGQPTLGQRWRAHEGGRRRRATRRDRRARAATSIAAASAPASTFGTRTPVRSCCTTSGRPPDSNATTGVSHSCASTATRPSPSSTDGTTRAAGTSIERGKLGLRYRSVPPHAIGDSERARQAARARSRSSPSPTTSRLTDVSGIRLSACSSISIPFCLLSRPTNSSRVAAPRDAVGRKQLGRHGHRRDDRRGRRDDLLRFGCEPLRHRRYGSRVLHHVSKRGARERDRARESNVGAVQRRHERLVGHACRARCPTSPFGNHQCA